MIVLYSIPKFSGSTPILVSSLNDVSEDGNPCLSTHFPLIRSIEHELSLTP
jgi:hypothetical protein